MNASLQQAAVDEGEKARGPYGWLVVDPGLNEEHWQARDAPLDEIEKRDGLVAFPLLLAADDEAALWATVEKRSDETDERAKGQ